MTKRKLGKAILRSNVFQGVAAAVLYGLLWFIYHTNRRVDNVEETNNSAYQDSPVIFVFWHGQHLLVPFTAPKGKKLVAMVSKSADAEINARFLKLAGHDVVRGSGGRDREATKDKGGVSALLGLKTALADGRDVGIIADISKGAPRKSGKGVVSLAKISGRPIVAIAYASSRYKVIESSWDKTTLNLPFGRSCVRVGNPIYVSSDSSEEEIEMARKRVDGELNKVTSEAYEAIGSSS